MSREQQKLAAGRAAADLVMSGMRVGLGSGSTAKHAVIELGHRLDTGVLADIVGS
jgi:ribose 5-phosphate isomerase A